MRIDKFLKVSRILKRRSVSKELADNQRIEINKFVKPSHEVKVGDLVGITFGNRKIIVRVLDIMDIMKKEDAKNSYEIVSDEFINY